MHTGVIAEIICLYEAAERYLWFIWYYSLKFCL